MFFPSTLVWTPLRALAAQFILFAIRYEFINN